VGQIRILWWRMVSFLMMKSLASFFVMCFYMVVHLSRDFFKVHKAVVLSSLDSCHFIVLKISLSVFSLSNPHVYTDGLGYYVDGGEEDDDLVYDGSDNEDEAGDNDDDDVYFDEEKYILKNAYTPIFDAAYPPVGEIVQLSDEQFKTEVLQPFVIKKFNFVPYFADGVDGMIKRAMYAFVVGTLCAN